MNELDTYVQTCLRDYGMSPWRRAKMAAHAIESYARAEGDLPDEVVLPIPLEWEHRVPAEGNGHTIESLLDLEASAAEAEHEAELLREARILHASLDPEPGHYGGTLEVGDLKKAFDHMYDGEDEQAQAKFDKFWQQ